MEELAEDFKDWVYDMDFAYMYPTEMKAMSEALIDVKPYAVQSNYPYIISFISPSEINEIEETGFKAILDFSSSFSASFDIRIEAEKYRLECLISLNDANVDNYKKLLETIEIDHPEWMI
jgi:hypothetical protein